VAQGGEAASTSPVDKPLADSTAVHASYLQIAWLHHVFKGQVWLACMVYILEDS